MENELSRVVDALPGLVWTALADGHIDFFNQRCCEYTGVSVDEASGQGWQTAIHPEDLAVRGSAYPSVAPLSRVIMAVSGQHRMMVQVPRFHFLFLADPQFWRKVVRNS